jgi:hypothetical protein
MLTQERWARKQATLLARSSLPLQFLAHEDSAQLIELAQLAPTRPTLLTPTTAGRRLQSIVKED